MSKEEEKNTNINKKLNDEENDDDEDCYDEEMDQLGEMNMMKNELPPISAASPIKSPS